MPQPDVDDDELDGCELDFTEDPNDDETAELLALFPDGVADPAKAAEWEALAKAAGDAWPPPEARFSDDLAPSDPEIAAEG
jgi:hypothetical protein